MKQVLFKISLLSIVAFAAIFFIACEKEKMAPAEAETTQAAEEFSTDDRACTTVTDACGAGNYGNCVLYARCKVPSLPYGLSTYAAKVAIINTYSAAAGRVAIINVGNNVGHVAYVQSVSGTSITIRETNWCSTTKVSTRTGTASALKIVGYFKP